MDLATLALIAAVQVSTTLPALKLPRGFRVRPDAVAVTAGVFMLEPASLCMSLAAGSLLAAGMAFRREGLAGLRVRAIEVLRRLPLWYLCGVAAVGLTTALPRVMHGAWVVPLALGLGLSYVLADSVTSVAVESSRARLAGHVHLVSSLRPLFSLLVGQVSLGAAMVVLSRGVGAWGVIVIIPIVATIQYSFNLLLETKATYVQTIEALMRAAEAGSSVPEAHSRRVAELAVDAGRALGLRSARLERLNHAALVHEIGRLSVDESTPGSSEDYGRMAARILQHVPFLEASASLVGVPDEGEVSVTPVGRRDGSTERMLLRAACVVDWDLSQRGIDGIRSREDLRTSVEASLDRVPVSDEVRTSVLRSASGPDSRWADFWIKSP